MDQLLLREEVILRYQFFFGVGEDGHWLFGHLLEYTVRSSNIADSGAVVGCEYCEVAFVEARPPLLGFAVAECQESYK